MDLYITTMEHSIIGQNVTTMVQKSVISLGIGLRAIYTVIIV